MDLIVGGFSNISRRKSHRKVRSGCRTCRIRRVKCDETRPSCNRCISTGRTCDGYGVWGENVSDHGNSAHGATLPPVNIGRVTTLRVHIDPIPLFKANREEKACFDYFRRFTTVKICGAFRSNFWDTIVLQAGSTEPAVFHAAVALASAHRSEVLMSRGSEGRGSCPDPSLMDKHEVFALRQYNKAISLLQTHLIGTDRFFLRTALITCMLFVCVEILRGQYMTGNAHLQNGLNILGEIQGHDCPQKSEILLLRPQPESIDDHLIEAFARLNIQSALFGNGSKHLFVVAQNLNRGPDFQIPDIFESVSQARKYLDSLINGTHLLIERCAQSNLSSDRCHIEQANHQQRLQARLLSWMKTYEASKASLISKSNPRTVAGIPLLQLHCIMVTVMISTCLSSADETVYDLHIRDFVMIVTQASDLWKRVSSQADWASTSSSSCIRQELKFTIDMGMIPPLYYTGLKCREPRIRRHAMELLRASPHREGIWDGVVVAFILSRVIALEERDFYTGHDVDLRGDMANSGSPGQNRREHHLPLLPRSARMHEVRVMLPDNLQSPATLVCKRRGENGGQEVMTSELHFPAIHKHF